MKKKLLQVLLFYLISFNIFAQTESTCKKWSNNGVTVFAEVIVNENKPTLILDIKNKSNQAITIANLKADYLENYNIEIFYDNKKVQYSKKGLQVTQREIFSLLLDTLNQHQQKKIKINIADYFLLERSGVYKLNIKGGMCDLEGKLLGFNISNLSFKIPSVSQKITKSISNLFKEKNALKEDKINSKSINFYKKMKYYENNIKEKYAMYYLGDFLYNGRKGIVQNQRKGREYYKKAINTLLHLAENNDNIAQYHLGRCYEYGKNNSKKAREWYIKSADNGNSNAMVKAAMFIAKRKGGGKKDDNKVMFYIKKSIKLKNPDGIALMASFYIEGRKDTEKGIKLAQEAVKMNSSLGQMILGAVYLHGMGSIKKDELKAMKLFQLSLDQGNSLVNNTLIKLKSKYLELKK